MTDHVVVLGGQDWDGSSAPPGPGKPASASS